MKSRTKGALALVAAFVLGGAAVEGLHAQARAKAIYVIGEIDVTSLDAYTKEYTPKAQALIKKYGGQRLAGGQEVKSYQGTPPASRVTIQRWDSEEQYMKYRNSAEFKENRDVGDKYARFRTYSVEALN
jgi:uncharacterized protein (DUF1330 family)